MVLAEYNSGQAFSVRRVHAEYNSRQAFSGGGAGRVRLLAGILCEDGTG